LIAGGGFLVKIGLMGFGRIGRNLFRQLRSQPEIAVAAIVDVVEPKGAVYLLKYDSIYGRFPEPVTLQGTNVGVGDQSIPFLNARQPGEVDWGSLGVQVVVQATGVKYRTAEWCRRHLASGAERVVLASTPENPGEIPILLTGVNDEILGPATDIVAMGSNTSNALAPLLRILEQGPGLDRAFFTTVHAFTNRERLADVPTNDFRSSRAAGENIIPAETGTPQILEQVMPELKGKIAGMALNVPVPDGSTIDTVAILSQPVSKESLNQMVREAAVSRYPGIFEYAEDPIVSTDVIGSTYSGVYDSLATLVMEETMAKTVVWFDNGWGYAARIVETISKLGKELS